MNVYYHLLDDVHTWFQRDVFRLAGTKYFGFFCLTVVVRWERALCALQTRLRVRLYSHNLKK